MKQLLSRIPVFGAPVVITVDGEFIKQMFAVGCSCGLALLLLVGTWRMVPVALKLASIMGRDFEQVIDDQPQPREGPTTLVAIPDSCFDRK
jgi:hypothetical protein